MNLRCPLVALLVVTTLALPSCGNDSETQSLTVYSGRSEKLIGPIFDDFEAATGIDVAVRYGSSNDMALALSAEGDKTPADVFLSRSPGPIGYLDDLGMLSPLEAGVLLGSIPDTGLRMVGGGALPAVAGCSSTTSTRSRKLIYPTPYSI